ncbi:MAG: S8 family serine peptidase [Roseburia sp.]|nr:S8 family serine peptidase [Roseburia sp.]
MKKRILSFLLAGLLVFTPPCPLAEAKNNPSSGENAPSDTNISDGKYIDGTVLVTIAAPKETTLTREGKTSFDKNISVEEAYDLGSASDLSEDRSQKQFLEDKTLYLSEVSSKTYSTPELIDQLENKAYVMSVEPDYVQYLDSVSDDPASDEQWYLDQGGSFGGSSSGISYTSTKSKQKTGTPVIAVMDTGIDYTHEDLADRMWVNSDITLGGIYGYDFTEENAYCMDTLGHGTHCAGVIAAAADNQKGIAGISSARLMALKVFDQRGETSNSIIVKALNYIIQAKNAGVNITAVNCSWGGGRSNSSMATLIKQIGSSGTLFIFAAGNDSIDHDPAPLSCPYDLYTGRDFTENRNYIIITGSSDPNDAPSDFSDYGSQDVDMFAPGERILSTYCESTYFPGIYDTDTETALTAAYFPLDTTQEAARFYTEEQLGLTPDIPSSLTYNTEKDYRESPSSGSLLWTLSPRKGPSFEEPVSYLYLDVTEYAPADLERTCYVSMLLGETDSNGFFIWEHVVKESSGEYGSEDNRFYEAPDGKIYFRVIGIAPSNWTLGNIVYSVDDVGISVPDPDTSLFGQYEIMNGTSMSAPMVTGAAALLSEVYPNDSVTDRRGRLLSCVRTVPALSGKCITGGVLDLKNMDLYTPQPEKEEITPPVVPTPAISSTGGNTQKTPVKTVKISSSAKKTYTVQKKTSSGKIKKIRKTKKVKLKSSKITLNAGDKLKLTATVSPAKATVKKVKWSSSRKKWASVSQKGIVTAKQKGRGHTVSITASATDGSRKKATCKIKIRK